MKLGFQIKERQREKRERESGEGEDNQRLVKFTLCRMNFRDGNEHCNVKEDEML